ncbi:MAG: hypothetical protein AAF415_08455 [Pseudomonadota bacterium]
MRIVLIAAALAAGCVAPTDPIGRDRLGQEATLAHGVWSDGASISVAAKLKPHYGRIAVCGAWAVDRGSALTDSFHDRIIDAGLVRVDGRVVAQGLRFMRQAADRRELTDGVANCVVTDQPWEARLADTQPVLRLPRQVFGGGTGSDEQRLVFRQIAANEEVLLWRKS